MRSGFFQPLNNAFRLAWIWWVILLSFQQIIFFECNMKLNWFSSLLGVLVIVIFYFLIRQRRFFASRHHLYFTSDFKMKMQEFDCDGLTAVKVSSSRVSFVYAGKYYEYIVFGSSHALMLDLLKENDIEYSTREKKKWRTEVQN